MQTFLEEYAAINGIDHFLLHYPKAPDAPVLLYLHGGPGSFESLFAYELDRVWGDMFTHVHWDQRGAGKTLRRNKRADWPQTVDQMLDDLHGVIGHLRRKYAVEQVVLLGHSWGSLLGSLYALRHPEHVLAYIGVGQVVDMVENERTAYQQTMEMAKKAGDQRRVRALEKLGGYPDGDPQLLLKQLPKMRKIQQAYDHGPVSGSGLGEVIKIIRRSPSFQWGDLISFMRIMQVNRPLHLQLLSFNLREYLPQYQTPVHYILGQADTIAPASLSQAYLDTVDAPCKTVTVLPGAGHNPMYEQPGPFAAALRAVRETLDANAMQVVHTPI